MLKDIVESEESEFEEKMTAITTLKHIEKNKINSAVNQVKDKGLLLLIHLNKYFEHKQYQELAHTKRVIEADKAKNKSARRTITTHEDENSIIEVNDNTKALIALEHSKIIAALKIIETSAETIMRLVTLL